MRFSEWNNFNSGDWEYNINVRDFINKNYTEYKGDSSFLAGPTERTTKLWNKVLELYKEEKEKGGILGISTIPSSILTHDVGYIDKDNELIVGLQTEEPLKRAIMPKGGIRVVDQSLAAYDIETPDELDIIFNEYTKTHNQGVYDAYTHLIRDLRRSMLITGLPDGYGRGRIIGDYRRVALYGTKVLIEEKEKEWNSITGPFNDKTMQLKEELMDQLRSLKELEQMAEKYGYDISRPASNSPEVIQWTYFAYLAAVKEQNGAAMSLGRVSTFFDIYFERDLKAGYITESEIQELIDDFVIKLRLVRFLRTPEYDSLFSGDPVWVTEAIGGMGNDGRSLVSKSSFRILQTLNNIGAAPEPNLTVLWSENLPEAFKEFCAEISINTSSIQYENDDIMRPMWNDDYAIACCVSAMEVGKQMQFFGARCNLAKALLYAINGGVDEITKQHVLKGIEGINSEYLEYDEVVEKFDKTLDIVAREYINALNIIHYMHDKYAYEKIEMALHDKDILRTMACGIAGLSIVADSLSAIKYAKVKPIRDENGIAIDFEIEGDYPKFGNDDDKVDSIAVELVETFIKKLEQYETYRDSKHTLSILTITSNVVYGKNTGATPDGRESGFPFGPGANPLHGRDTHGPLAVLNSLAKLPYEHAKDGISYTFAVTPTALGKSDKEKVDNLKNLLDVYFKKGGHHINVNVFHKELLLDAMEHPEKYPQLTIRVSGYAVNFVKLTKEQQLDVINRTIHERLK